MITLIVVSVLAYNTEEQIKSSQEFLFGCKTPVIHTVCAVLDQQIVLLPLENDASMRKDTPKF